MLLLLLATVSLQHFRNVILLTRDIACYWLTLTDERIRHTFLYFRRQPLITEIELFTHASSYISVQC